MLVYSRGLSTISQPTSRESLCRSGTGDDDLDMNDDGILGQVTIQHIVVTSFLLFSFVFFSFSSFILHARGSNFGWPLLFLTSQCYSTVGVALFMHRQSRHD
ncbi:uncharacterized protein B0J16DRAFT_344245, partial [Fusarium flagelliforme]|uniref:uncharacterized protein n=1 Tax=Fusarium flagelliforme TaxID=2675880 RepID=UPI001E8EC653